jgi:hypothetical protein
MRFLANENFPGTAVTALIAAGHDVVWARNAAPGISDADVLAWAARDERIRGRAIRARGSKST